MITSLSETRSELIANANSHGWSLEGIEFLELLADEMQVDGARDQRFTRAGRAHQKRTFRDLAA